MVKLSISQLSQRFVVAKDPPNLLPAGCLVVTAFGSASRHQHMLSQIKSSEDVLRHIVALGPDEPTPNQIGSSVAVSLINLRKAIRSSVPLLLGRGETFSLFVDVSCLSRQQLGEIMAAVKDIAQAHLVNLTIAYTLGRFVSPPGVTSTPIRRIAPVNASFAGWTRSPGKPVDVILGLGYEKGKALGAVEYLEPRKTWIFIPHSPELQYLAKVREHNKDLLRRDPAQQLPYNVMEPVETYFTMLSLVTGISRDSRPILLPFGPKIYFALALLVAIAVEEASVWFVDGDDPSMPAATLPSEHAVIMSCLVSPLQFSIG